MELFLFSMQLNTKILVSSSTGTSLTRTHWNLRLIYRAKDLYSNRFHTKCEAMCEKAGQLKMLILNKCVVEILKSPVEESVFAWGVIVVDTAQGRYVAAVVTSMD